VWKAQGGEWSGREVKEGKGKGKKGKGYEERNSTSAEVTVSAAQSTLGRTLYINFGFNSMVSETSSHSLGCRGKLAEEDLQALTAQVRKLRVRTFIFARRREDGEVVKRCWCGE
jgi:hypothetical protein